MIEELLSSVVEVDNNRTKLSHSHIPSVLTSPSQSPTTSSSETIITANAANNQNNLRCPRCDSSNTKFCYYNNYNLTQPRHFCKTCRRYWTKGGALRNVPIGGGCRKTKSAVSPPSIVKSSGMPSCTKPNNTMTSLDFMGRAVPDVLLPSSPILWAGVPQSSHLLALLRASQMQQNPNPSFFNSVRVKEEGGRLDANGGCVNLENFGGFPVNTGGAPLWRSTENQYQFMMNGNQQVQQAPTQSLLLSEVPTSSGIQELYQRLKSSTMGSYGGDSEQFQGNGSNVGVATSMGSSVNVASSSIMDQIPLTGGEFGYWNPMMAWSDLSTANGAFP